MGVLESMRSGSDSTFMQVVLALVVVSFVGWYAQPQGDKSRVIADVNGEKIMDTDYGRAYRNALRNAEARAGRTFSDAEQKQLGEQVKQDMIENEVLLQEAYRLGLEVSGYELEQELAGLQFLMDDDGRFSMDLYQRFLKRQQFTRPDFEQRLREDLLREKLRQLVFMGASISEPALRDAWIESETRVDLTVVRVWAGAFNDDVEINDEERASWLAENEERVREIYDRDFDRLYDHPAQVRLRMIRLGITADGPSLADLVPKLNVLREELEAGADFADLAARWSEDPSAAQGGDLGLRPVPQMLTETIEAIRELEPGQVSRVVTTDSDVRLYKLEERVEPTVDAFEDVKNDIADQLIRDERTPALAASFAEEQLLPTWQSAGEVPSDLITEKGLTSRDTGPIPTVSQRSPFSPPQALLSAARTAEVGAVIPRVFEEDGTLWVAQLTDRTEPDMDTFEEQRDQIREGVLRQRRVSFYQAWVADAKSRATIQ